VGNALEFLRKKDRRDKQRKRRKAAKKPRKIDTTNTVVTVCPDAVPASDIVAFKDNCLNMTSIKICDAGYLHEAKHISERLAPEIICQCCAKKFSQPTKIPRKYKYCISCRGLNNHQKRMMTKKLGSYDDYVKLKSFKPIGKIKDTIPMEELQDMIRIYTKLGRETKTLEKIMKIKKSWSMA